MIGQLHNVISLHIWYKRMGFDSQMVKVIKVVNNNHYPLTTRLQHDGCLSSRSTWFHPSFSEVCFARFVCPFSFDHCIACYFFDLRLLITPLVSSKIINIDMTSTVTLNFKERTFFNLINRHSLQACFPTFDVESCC